MSRKVLWLSDDGTEAVVRRGDLERGVHVGWYCSSVADAIATVTGSFPNVPATSPYSFNQVCKVRTKDLRAKGWTMEELGLVPGTYQERDQVRAHAPSQGPRAVAEWPKACPRCGRAGAAVELFSSWDCRFGCFK